MLERTLVLISIGVLDTPEDEVSIEHSHLRCCLSVPHTESFPPACLELSLVYFSLENLPPVEVLQPRPELSNVLGGIGYEYAITMQ
jgi:hypothetical protein